MRHTFTAFKTPVLYSFTTPAQPQGAAHFGSKQWLHMMAVAAHVAPPPLPAEVRRSEALPQRLHQRATEPPHRERRAALRTTPAARCLTCCGVSFTDDGITEEEGGGDDGGTGRRRRCRGCCQKNRQC